MVKSRFRQSFQRLSQMRPHIDAVNLLQKRRRRDVRKRALPENLPFAHKNRLPAQHRRQRQIVEHADDLSVRLTAVQPKLLHPTVSSASRTACPSSRFSASNKPRLRMR